MLCVVCTFFARGGKKAVPVCQPMPNTVRQVLKGNHRHYCSGSVSCSVIDTLHLPCVIEVWEALRWLFRTINIAKDFENIAPFSFYLYVFL